MGEFLLRFRENSLGVPTAFHDDAGRACETGVLLPYFITHKDPFYSTPPPPPPQGSLGLLGGLQVSSEVSGWRSRLPIPFYDGSEYLSQKTRHKVLARLSASELRVPLN